MLFQEVYRGSDPFFMLLGSIYSFCKVPCFHLLARRGIACANDICEREPDRKWIEYILCFPSRIQISDLI